MSYNMTGLDTANNFYEVLTVVNTASSYTVSYLILALIYLFMMIMLKHYGTPVASITSSASVTLLAILLWSIGWLSFGIIFIPVALLFGSMVWFGLSGGE